MMRARRTLALAALTAGLLPAGTAFAAIPLTKAKATAYRAGVSAAKQTHGTRPQVLSCQAKTSRRDLCKVKIHYATGAKSCVVDVTVRYKSRRSSTLVYAFGQTVCS